MTEIKVPKTPPSAFNPDRPAPALLRAQIMHLEHAAGVPESPPGKKWKEGAAARYIGELTARITGRPLPAPPKKKSTPKKKSAAKASKKPRRR